MAPGGGKGGRSCGAPRDASGGGDVCAAAPGPGSGRRYKQGRGCGRRALGSSPSPRTLSPRPPSACDRVHRRARRAGTRRRREADSGSPAPGGPAASSAPLCSRGAPGRTLGPTDRRRRRCGPGAASAAGMLGVQGPDVWGWEGAHADAPAAARPPGELCRHWAGASCLLPGCKSTHETSGKSESRLNATPSPHFNILLS